MLTNRERTALGALLGPVTNRPGVYLNPDQRVGLDKLLRDWDGRAAELQEHNDTLDLVVYRATGGKPDTHLGTCPCGDVERAGHPKVGYCARGLGGLR